MLPIMIFGGLFAVIGSAPATEDATGFMRVWADFVASNSKIFSWISVLGLGFTTLYIVIGITYNLCKSYRAIDPSFYQLFWHLYLECKSGRIGLWDVFGGSDISGWERNHNWSFCRYRHRRYISCIKREKLWENQIAGKCSTFFE